MRKGSAILSAKAAKATEELKLAKKADALIQREAKAVAKKADASGKKVAKLAERLAKHTPKKVELPNLTLHTGSSPDTRMAIAA